MYILAIETTGKIGSVALADLETYKMTMKTTTEAMSHLKNLMAMTQELFREQKVTGSDIAAVAASVGPGSFTGIRIGVSSARAVAQALHKPCIQVPTLDTFRLKCGNRPVAVIFNARRGQVYGAVFDKDKKDILKPGPYMLTDVLDAVDKAGIAPIFYGDGVDAYADKLQGRECAQEEDRYQTATMTAAFAMDKLEAGETCTYEELLPDYMRETEAEQKLRDGSLARARAAKMAKFRSR
ncbi:MAG: tRNA (adenosine(37)-N6)-threonylcarbamoyltransferase complex dimerization subunit type 1 TsaB [Clostridiales bacterium]|nr:tRNA (adenosine(37)-N6)-threonylcarbamoyltransferase complex dimerization subunit type 1 TsaB [Clostridiales bacterium]